MDHMHASHIEDCLVQERRDFPDDLLSVIPQNDSTEGLGTPNHTPSGASYDGGLSSLAAMDSVIPLPHLSPQIMSPSESSPSPPSTTSPLLELPGIALNRHSISSSSSSLPVTSDTVRERSAHVPVSTLATPSVRRFSSPTNHLESPMHPTIALEQHRPSPSNYSVDAVLSGARLATPGQPSQHSGRISMLLNHDVSRAGHQDWPQIATVHDEMLATRCPPTIRHPTTSIPSESTSHGIAGAVHTTDMSSSSSRRNLPPDAVYRRSHDSVYQQPSSSSAFVQGSSLQGTFQFRPNTAFSFASR